MPGKGHSPGSHSGMLLRSIGADAWRSGFRGCVAEFLDLGFAPWHGLDSRCGTLLCIAPIIRYGPARAIAQDRIEFPGTRNPTGGQVPRMRKSAMSKGRAGGSSGWCRRGATLWRSSCERCGERASNVAGGEDGLLDAPQARLDRDLPAGLGRRARRYAQAVVTGVLFPPGRDRCPAPRKPWVPGRMGANGGGRLGWP